jgi:hypothetical protein
MTHCFRIRARLARAATVALLAIASPLGAQVQQGGGTDPIDQVLVLAQQAYDALAYPRADSIARSLLALGPGLSARQRTRAMILSAAASYPEEAESQHRDVAVASLRELMRTNLSFRFPQELTWPGLDSLVEELRRTTFGVEATADSVQTGVGPQGAMTVRVRSSLPGRLFVTVTAVNGGGNNVVYLDSAIATTSAEFRIPTMRANRPLFETGAYYISIMGTDSSSADAVAMRFVAQVDAPPLEFVTIPASIDSTKLLPERAHRFGYKSIVPAVILGGGAFALASVLRPQDGSIKQSVGADSKGYAIGGGIALLTIAGGFLDRGRPIHKNIEANQAYREAFAKAVTAARAENLRRIAEYRTTVRFDSEAR